MGGDFFRLTFCCGQQSSFGRGLLYFFEVVVILGVSTTAGSYFVQWASMAAIQYSYVAELVVVRGRGVVHFIV